MSAMRALLSCLTGLPLLFQLACGEASSGDPPLAESQVAPSDRSGQVTALRQRAAERFGALAAGEIPMLPVEAARFALGRELFFEKRLSADGQVACATCHMAEHGGADGLAKSVGVLGRVNPRNAPTVFNAALQTSQHWRADRDSLADQAARSPLGAGSFGNEDEAQALDRLRDAGYEAEFTRAFPEAESALTLASFGEAVAEFEQTLRTPGRFDDFLQGEDAALDARELAGLALFMEQGCADCHTGPGLGGEQLAKFGIVEDYAQATDSPEPDQGRFDVTHAEEDRYVFKVPVLRNVAETAPYFHDGSVIGLEQAVRVMARVQLGKQLEEHEVRDLVAFLGALSGSPPPWFSEPQR